MPEVLLERPSEHVALVRLNRPEVRNALNLTTRRQISEHFTALGADPSVRAIVMTGDDQAFAAGADLNEMKDATPVDMMLRNVQKLWGPVAGCMKPMIAAVNGFALGGGCELAMHCDLIIAADNARFGQPEIKLGVIPGMGGTQRLVRAVGKSKAMDMILTGRLMDAAEAERSGLVSRVVPLAELMNEAMKTADTIASLSLPSVMVAKEAVNRAFELSLAEGLLFERRVFHALFATEDQKEGMAAFVEKRPAQFKHR